MNAAIYFVVCLMVLVNGAAIGFGAGYLVWGRKKVTPAEVPSEDELAKAMQEREDLIRSQQAFQTMMGYNADVAYGLRLDDED